MGSLGPNKGTKKPEELLFFNHLVNQYGLDPVSHGFVLSFAMELYENKIITNKDTGGLSLSFGNFQSAVKMTSNIINRKNTANRNISRYNYSTNIVNKKKKERDNDPCKYFYSLCVICFKC